MRRDDRACSARISPLKNWHRGTWCSWTECRYPPQQSTKMSNAVAQLGPSVKFTVAKSSRKSCWVRSPQKITVVTGMKSGRKVTIVTGIMVSGTVVNSMKLTNPVTLNTVLPDPNVPRKLPPPQPSRQTRSTARIRRMARLLQNQILLHFHICQQQREFCTKSDDRKVGRACYGQAPSRRPFSWRVCSSPALFDVTTD